jgi:hypothetical protein
MLKVDMVKTELDQIFIRAMIVLIFSDFVFNTNIVLKSKNSLILLKRVYLPTMISTRKNTVVRENMDTRRHFFPKNSFI